MKNQRIQYDSCGRCVSKRVSAPNEFLYRNEQNNNKKNQKKNHQRITNLCVVCCMKTTEEKNNIHRVYKMMMMR